MSGFFSQINIELIIIYLFLNVMPNDYDVLVVYTTLPCGVRAELGQHVALSAQLAMSQPMTIVAAQIININADDVS